MRVPPKPSPVHFFFAVYAGWVNRHQLAVIDCLRAELAVLREHVPHKRIPFTQAQRLRLARAGHRAGRAILREYATLASPDTVLRWYREMVARKYDGSALRRAGRPPLPSAIRERIATLASENPSWGYTRLLGNLAALGIEISRSSIRRVLLEVGLGPNARRGPGLTWKRFLQAHWSALAATDFFTVEALTFRGLVRLHVLFVIELQSRAVEIAGIVPEPDGAWLMRRARKMLATTGSILESKTHLIMDRGSVFTAELRAFLADAGIEPVRLPPRSPNLNAHAERFVRSVRNECLDHMVIFSEAHLRTVLREYVAHYNHERPHQGIGNVLIRAPPQPANSNGRVKRKRRLGGLLNYYYRGAA